MMLGALLNNRMNQKASTWMHCASGVFGRKARCVGLSALLVGSLLTAILVFNERGAQRDAVVPARGGSSSRQPDKTAIPCICSAVTALQPQLLGPRVKGLDRGPIFRTQAAHCGCTYSMCRLGRKTVHLRPRCARTAGHPCNSNCSAAFKQGCTRPCAHLPCMRYTRGLAGGQALENPLCRMQMPLARLLTPEEQARGVTYYGSGSRLRRMAGKLLAGRPITAVALGGSVTYGHGVDDASQAYPALFFALLNASFPHRCEQRRCKQVTGAKCL